MKIPHLDLPNEDDVLQRDAWIAVAYPQRWYTESASRGTVNVDLGEPSKKLGSFKYPDGRDIQEVERCFLLKTNITVSPSANLRY
ncbi:hypothetical protein ElyMa_000556700 [Elysia marginata]|uniref:Uncharacterized protein n=1 Tax=Elysia marginata TaxID=1093978 RepID=A0AAV4G2H7_9GAST|nr:hypothetical protein ElyMa_000556700 [Elysia marginata]